jgi:two-component system, OmpR family, sensor histidine kinase VicK
LEEQSVVNAVKSEILYGADNIVNRTIQDFHMIKERLDNCIDFTGPSVFKTPIVWKELVALWNRGVKLRFITEITKDNINYSKELSKVAELRHLDRVKGNFGIADGKDYGGSASVKEGEPPIELIRSNVKAFVEQQQYFFETLWNKAIPAEQKIKEIEDGIPTEKTEVLHRTENTTKAIVEFLSRVLTALDICADHAWPSVAMGLEVFKQALTAVNKKSITKSRFVTEITKDNIDHCKELMNLGELRHLDGIKGNFAVSEREYIASATMQESSPLQQVIHSNVKEIVEQEKFVFESFWSRAIPAQIRIREIEEGIMPIRTRIIENQDEIIKEIKRKNNSASKLSVCSCFGGMQMSHNFLFDSFEKVIDKHRKGESEGLRWIISIDKESIPLVKAFIKAGIRVRHIKNTLPMNFGVSDKEVSITIEKMEGGKMSQSILISNDPLYTVHFNSVFEELWKAGIDAKERITHIEDGADLADIEVIPSAAKAREIYIDALKKAQKNIIIVFPTKNAFLRQNKIGVVRLAKEAAEQRNVMVRILMPRHESTEQLVRRLTERNSYSNYNNNNNIDLRYIKQTRLNTQATILIVDEEVSLVMEIRDDSKDTFDEAIGLSTYSNSKAGVLSYVSFFEHLWLQTELYNQIKESSIRLEQANKQLIAHDKMQKEFIDIAAHELRTPIQPILGLSHLLLSKTGNIEQYNELLSIINRNAKRLNRLSDDILDATKIESKSLELKKEQFNLNDVILHAIDDILLGKRISSENLQLLYEPHDILLHADKSRVAEVISNLLINAIKFTQKGTIVIHVEKDENNRNDNRNCVIVNVKDTGQGIDVDILPRLFTKFASSHGTGLGLFISKGIVEAHLGKIWAKNNIVGTGATFSFSLPVDIENDKHNN